MGTTTNQNLTAFVYRCYFSDSYQGPVSRTSRELFGPGKLVVKLQSARFEKLIFLHAFNMRKIKRIAKFEGLEPRRCEDIKGIVVPDIGPKSFGTFKKQAPGLCYSFPLLEHSFIIHLARNAANMHK